MSKRTLKKEFMIDGKVVFKVANFCGIDVYQSESSEHEESLHFVKDDKVVQTLNIEADCGQNVGYISSLGWEE